MPPLFTSNVFKPATFTDLNAGSAVPGVSRGRRVASFLSAPALSSSSILVDYVQGSWYYEFWINRCHIVHNFARQLNAGLLERHDCYFSNNPGPNSCLTGGKYHIFVSDPCDPLVRLFLGCNGGLRPVHCLTPLSATGLLAGPIGWNTTMSVLYRIRPHCQSCWPRQDRMPCRLGSVSSRGCIYVGVLPL